MVLTEVNYYCSNLISLFEVVLAGVVGELEICHGVYIPLLDDIHDGHKDSFLSLPRDLQCEVLQSAKTEYSSLSSDYSDHLMETCQQTDLKEVSFFNYERQ